MNTIVIRTIRDLVSRVNCCIYKYIYIYIYIYMVLLGLLGNTILAPTVWCWSVFLSTGPLCTVCGWNNT
jgi:hypothetical protein